VSVLRSRRERTPVSDLFAPLTSFSSAGDFGNSHKCSVPVTIRHPLVNGGELGDRRDHNNVIQHASNTQLIPMIPTIPSSNVMNGVGTPLKVEGKPKAYGKDNRNNQIDNRKSSISSLL
jgi:hypothetical protein